MTAALAFGGSEISPAEFERRMACTASVLERLGVTEGDVVALMLYNNPEFMEALLACRLLGAYYCPINWHFKSDEAGFILRDSGAKALVVQAELLPQIAPGLPSGLALAEVDAGWSARRDAQAPWSGKARPPRGNMPYTSGTTGRPKGVRRLPASDEQRARAMALYRTALGLEPGMRALLCAPLYHSAPNLYAVQAAINGALLVLEPRFDAEATLALIERYRLTHAYLVPTMFVRLLRLPAEMRRRYDLSSLGFISSTGSPCAPDVKRAMIDWLGPIVNETYASSECGHVTFIDSPTWLVHPGSVGRPLGNGIVKILDDAGRELPPGEIGLIYCRQPAYPDFTYTNNAAARAAIERDGLWSVGDMGYLDAEGYLYVADRKSDMVISGGVNIYPAEIEAALMTMPVVGDCAVFGIPDGEFGEALAAAIELRDGQRSSAEDVQRFLRERLANYKVPKVIAFHASLPREESGKIFKRLLREPYWAGLGRRI
jgi:long-chain acyl-CoA synthetase